MVLPETAAEGYAKVTTLYQTDPDLNATKVSLELVLGVVSTVTLQLEPTFKRNVTFQVVNTQVGMEDRILEIAKPSAFGDVTWFPSTCTPSYLPH
jgi:L-gulonolactone oxidase